MNSAQLMFRFNATAVGKLPRSLLQFINGETRDFDDGISRVWVGLEEWFFQILVGSYLFYKTLPEWVLWVDCSFHKKSLYND